MNNTGLPLAKSNPILREIWGLLFDLIFTPIPKIDRFNRIEDTFTKYLIKKDFPEFLFATTDIVTKINN